ncbi:hypothetical protein VN12_10770 [Pirellula sp. SH-Sr6A]|uniref:hypothetical protein n=1 Tax=Pirellula sp. SH-Sr6A TaxID=1632865 RepID=UPI00078E1E9D|nr:hypothetical protein [Pirellula sp. SH-Sr6A]AMV32598.1 hypothetical protein VN12_10770 [Pirellula sp. SH-Sr6A]
MTSFLCALLHRPRGLLVLDAVGALNTSLATYFLLGAERWKTGLPIGILTAMSLAALGFAIWDMVSLLGVIEARVGLRVISGANLLYCFMAVVLLVIYRSDVTWEGVGYFGLEIAVILPLAVWEWIVAGRKTATASDCGISFFHSTEG